MAKNTRKKSHRRSTSGPPSGPPTPRTPGPPGPTPLTSGGSTSQTPSSSTPRTPGPPGPTPPTSGGSTSQTPSSSTPRTRGPPGSTPSTSGGSTPQTPSPSTPRTRGPTGPTPPTSGGSTSQTPSSSTPRTRGPPGSTPSTSGGSTPQTPSPSTPRTRGPTGPTPPTSGGSTSQTPRPSTPRTAGSSIPQADCASTSGSSSAVDRSEEELVAFVRYNCQNVYQADDSNPTEIKETEDDLRLFLDEGRRSIKALLPSRPQRVSLVNPHPHRVYVNHFKIEIPNNARFSLYKMTWKNLWRDAQPEGPGRFEERLKRLWWDEIYESNRAAHMDDIPTVYEGIDKMVAREPFKWGPGGVMTFTHNNGSEVTVKFIATINIDNYKKFTNQIASDECRFPKDVVKIVNLLARKYCTNPHYRDVKRWYYDLQSNDEQFQDPSMIKKFAYFQSARCLGGGTTGALSLNVDVASSIFFREGKRLPELWKLYGGEHLQATNNYGRSYFLAPFPDGIPNKIWTNEQVEYVHRLWRKIIIKTDHDRRQPRDFTIHDVTRGFPALEVQIPHYWYDPRQDIKTLKQLLQEKYGVTTTNTDWTYYLPALKVQKNKESYLTWNCCETTPESRFGGKVEELPYGVKSQLKKLDNPGQRHGNIANWMRDRAQRAPQFDACAGWGVTVSSEMMLVNALLLTKPRLEFRDSVSIPSHLGNFNVLQFDNENHTTTKLLETKGESYRYALLVMSMTDADFACWNTHLEVLNRMAPDRMVKLDEVTRKDHKVDNRIPATERLNTLRRTLDDMIKGVRQNRYGTFDIIICLMPKKLTPEYATLKYSCDIVHGVPSQVFIMNRSKDKGVKHKDVQSRVESFMLKINVKCGGQNFKVDRSLFTDASTMLLGADVTHGSPSIAALVATTDLNAGNYACRITSQDPNQEKIHNLERMFTELLDVYLNTTQSLPNNIIFFRDGVSEGEYVNTLRHEGTAILKACTARKRNYRPNLLVVLANPMDALTYGRMITWSVQIKRHHTRFFQRNASTRRIENLQEGVVVNEGVTHPREHEFFLCSQFPVLGTSRAVRYHVLLDEIYKTERANELYDLVYLLCHTCQRTTRSVALVTPTYYAHLAAFRAKLYMEYWKVENKMPKANPKPPREAWLDLALRVNLNAHENLRNRLWFL